MTLNEAIQIMTNKIVTVLADNKPAIYLFGSVALDDFQLGWSDIDILVLTDREVTEQQAETLVGLRQALMEYYPGNPYFRLFEGGMLSVVAFLHNNNERTVYWGTSGQRITDGYKIDSFGMAELLDYGILLYGDDIRSKIIYPTYAQMRDDITHHVQAAQTHGAVVGWLLDIARGLYTLRTGNIIAKTAAGEWALEEELCPDADILQKTVQIRKEPQRFSKDDKIVDNTVIQRFADVLDIELKAKKMIKAIFCDFYGTVVFEDDEPIRSIVERIYQTGNANSTKEIGEFWWKRFSELCAEAYGDRFRSQRELELQSLQDTLDRFHSADSVVELSKPQFEYWIKPPIFKDAKQFFEKCPVPIFIVSNIDKADLQTALTYHGLNPAGIVTSEDARAYKPRNEVFALALRKFGLASDEVVHIGDSVTSDVLGAKSVGIQSIWLNRKGKAVPPDVTDQVADLLGVIKCLAEYGLGCAMELTLPRSLQQLLVDEQMGGT